MPFLLKRNKSEFERLVFYGFVGVLVMLPLWADRWLHYASLPLAILGGVGITGLNEKWKPRFAKLLIVIFIIYVIDYFLFSFGVAGHWWNPGD